MQKTLYHYNLSSMLEEALICNTDRPALHYADTSHTFEEIASWTDSLATLLVKKGMQRGDRIAIGHNKHPLSYALMLAALRIGVVYINIDVASPEERNSKILSVCKPILLFYDDSEYQTEMKNLSKNNNLELIFLDFSTLMATSKSERQHQHNLSRRVDGSTIAYIMFTSGSTGTPKGVAITHQNLIHFISWARCHFQISKQDNFANLSPMYFDNSVFDFYISFFSGASLTPISRKLLAEPYELIQYVAKCKCTIWFSVPSLLMYLITMKAFSLNPLKQLRLIVFGGEGYPKIELKKLYHVFHRQATLVNVYGPTECTCICSAHTLNDEDFAELEGLPMLGRLNPNFDYRILNEENHDALAGELCLIGPNVAAGYFNDPVRTAQCFQTITDTNRFMKLMYRTGDLVQELAGNLYFIGRKDHQIKHMGYRIELEEIEYALMKLPQVDQAAVIYYRAQTAYGKLLAYVASKSAPDEMDLLKKLRQQLPAYMIPTKIIIMEKIPVNANGKIDRLQLHTLNS